MADFREVMGAWAKTTKFADAAQDESASDLDRSISASLAVAAAVEALGTQLDYLLSRSAA